MNPLLVTEHLSKNFSGVQALQDVSISIRRGQVHCLAGENGSGKSTFINLIGGFYQPDSGQLIINGKIFGQLQPIQAIREGIQIIYQDFSLFPNLSVAENLSINTLLEHKRRFISWREVEKIARNAVGQIGVTLDLEAKVSELSVAEKQLTAIARALLHDARLIVMDEPTTALTRKEVITLFRIVQKLQQDGIAILFVSHKLTEILEISDRITVLRNGVVTAEGPVSDYDHQKLATHMTGRKWTAGGRPPRREKTEKPSRLRVKNLYKKGAFRHITFDLNAGEIIGITGLLGSGRTKLALALFGIDPIDEGRIYIDEKQVVIKSIQDAISHGIAYLPEDRLTEGLFLQQPVEKNIVITVLTALLNRYKLLSHKTGHTLAGNWMKDLQIAAPSVHTAVQWLSGGNQQKTVLAKWLAASAGILLLNGPTVGVDIGAKADIHQKILELAARGIGILIISDDLPELQQICGRILLMHRGEIVDEYAGTDFEEEKFIEQMRQLK